MEIFFLIAFVFCLLAADFKGRNRPRQITFAALAALSLLGLVIAAGY